MIRRGQQIRWSLFFVSCRFPSLPSRALDTKKMQVGCQTPRLVHGTSLCKFRVSAVWELPQKTSVTVLGFWMDLYETVDGSSLGLASIPVGYWKFLGSLAVRNPQWGISTYCRICSGSPCSGVIKFNNYTFAGDQSWCKCMVILR